MANDVFANGREISCKAADGKSVAAFPDVCFTPPQTPGTPPGVPIPYPNTAFAKDTTAGSKKVKISRKEVMLKNKSHFKKSTGNEAGNTPKKGIVTSKTKGKVYFTSWSMDVKFEGKNVVRHMDMTTHNHGSAITNTGPWPHVDAAAFGKLDSCAGDKKAMKDACKGKKRCPGMLSVPVSEQIAKHGTSVAGAKSEKVADGSDCVKKSRCYLRPYEANKKEDGCCPGQTPHHVPPKACFQKSDGSYKKGYSMGKALCVCLEGANQHTGSHGKNHAAIEWLADTKDISPGAIVPTTEYNSLCAATISAQFGCDAKCIEDQLNGSTKKVKNVEHVDTNSSAKVSAADKRKVLSRAKSKQSRAK
jgi:hypothetical protein